MKSQRPGAQDRLRRSSLRLHIAPADLEPVTAAGPHGATLEGVQAGTPERVQAGPPAGSAAGTAAGGQAVMPAGSAAGPPAGSAAGTPAGVHTVTPAGTQVRAAHRLPVLRAPTPISFPFKSLFDLSSDALVGHDFLGRRVYTNRMYDRLVGYDGAQMLGRWGPFPDWDPAAERSISAGLRRARGAHQIGTHLSEPLIVRIQHVSGQSVTVAMHLDVLTDAAGEPTLGLALVSPVERVAWLERRRNRDVERVHALEDVVRAVAIQLSRVGVTPVSRSEAAGQSQQLTGRLEQLSSREWQVFQSILTGRRVTAIATELHLSPHTVRNHLKGVFRKLGVTSQVELVERYRAVNTSQPVG